MALGGSGSALNDATPDTTFILFHSPELPNSKYIPPIYQSWTWAGGQVASTVGTPFSTTGQSAYFPDSTGHVNGGQPFAIGTKDFIVQAWVYMPNDPPNDGVNSDCGVFGHINNVVFYLNNSTYDMRIWDGSHSFGSSSSTAVVTKGAWHFVEWSRVSGTVYAAIDGVVFYSAAYAYSLIPSVWVGSSNGSRQLRGYLYELRVKVGEGFSADHAMPTQPFLRVG